MSDDIAAKNDLPFKDLLVAAPLCGSTLAIAWEVGSFVPISLKAFGLFSVTEHLGFALQGFPVAMIVVLCGTIFFFTLGPGFSRKKRSIVADRTRDQMNNIQKLYFRQKNPLLFCAAPLLLGVFSILSGLMLPLALGGAIATLAMPAVLSRNVNGTVMIVLTFAVFFSFATASDVTSFQLKFPERNATTLETTSGDVDLVVLRYGERGILGYDWKQRAFRFLKWDELKRLNIKRPYGLFPWSFKR